MRKLFTALLVAAGVLAPVGVHASSPATLNLDSSFERACYRILVTGADGDETAVVEFKASSSSTWLTAKTPYYDTRATVGGVSNTSRQYEFRGQIYNLTNTTSYDVRVTLTDPDGVTGTNPVSGTILTRDPTPPNTGTAKSATTSTLATVLASINPGDAVALQPGTYTGGFSITRSGTSTDWIKIYAATPGTVTINGGTNGLTINGASYIWIKDIIFGDAVDHNVYCTGSSFTLLDSIQTLDCGSTSNYGDSSIRVNSNASRVWVINSDIGYSGNAAVASHGETFGFLCDSLGQGGHILQDTVIHGLYRDGAAASGEGSNSGMGYNVHFKRCTFYGVQDDCLEFEGQGINCATELCVMIKSTPGSDYGSALGSAGVYYGPTDHIRDTYRSLTGHAIAKDANYDYGPENWYHCVFDGSVANGTGGAAGDAFSGVGGSPLAVEASVYNCILGPYRNVYYNFSSTGKTFDYNYIISGFTGVIGNTVNGTNYSTLAAWRTGTGQDTHSVQGTNPYTNRSGGIYNLAAGSTAIDAGTIIANINDSSSGTPYQGGAPDIGVFETNGSDVTAPTVSSVVVNAAGTTVTVNLSEATILAGGTPTVTFSTVTLTYASGSGTPALVFTPSRTILRTADEGGTKTASCTLTTNQWQDAAGNDVVTWGPVSVTNISTQAAPDTTGPVVSNRSATSAASTTGSITWTTDESATGYVQYGLTTGYGSQTTTSALATSHSHRITGLSAGTLYHYRIVVTDALGNATTTTDGTFTTLALPTTPTSPSATKSGTSIINVSWSNVSGESGYAIERSLTGGGSGFSQVGTTAANVVTFGDQSLIASTTYYYRVRSYVTRDNTTDYSAYSAEASDTTDAPASSGTQSNPYQAWRRWLRQIFGR